MNVVGVIPARFGSTRFPGKVIAPIAGKPMIQHVWERASKAKLIDKLIIACDDSRVMEAAKRFKAQAVLTCADHVSGTDRIAQAVKGLKAKIVVNIQGDEPLVDPQIIDQLVRALQGDKEAAMATVIREITDDKEAANPNVVKVVIDDHGYALYFSRSKIPYYRTPSASDKYYQHLGIYAYRAPFLQKFVALSPSRLEKNESLEQLRALEAGYKIKTIKTDRKTIAVDTKEDLLAVERYLKNEK